MDLDSQKWLDYLDENAGNLGVDLAAEQLLLCQEFARALVLWNKKVNLTAIVDPRDMVIRHFADSLAPVPSLKNASRILDIGSGAGFPGIVIKIALPGLELVSVDSQRKKVSFQNHVVGALGLENARAVHARAQDLTRDKGLIQGFDVVISRAVADLETLWGLARPFLNKNGVFIAMKSQGKEQELEALKNNPAPPRIQATHYKLCGMDLKRTLFFLSEP